MTTFLPIHSLLSSGRPAEYAVYHDGYHLVSWSSFAARVAARTGQLQTHPASRWLLASEDPQDFVIGLLAVLHAGKQAVIPPNTQPGTLTDLAEAFDAVVPADEPPVLQEKPAKPLPQLNPHTSIIDIYTSGSTGIPKPIRKTLAQFESEIEALESLWGSALGNATIVATAPHLHFYGLLFRLFWPLSAGRVFDTVTIPRPDVLAERLAKLGDTALISSPAQLSRLPELVPLTSLTPPPRIIFSSGGPLPAATAAEFQRQLGRAPTEVFGSTETGGIGWRRQEGDDAWTPMPGMEITSAPDSALTLRSPFLADVGPWRMDDGVEILSDGRFRLRGRLDRVVKIEEKRLSLPEMEARLAIHPWIAGAATLALPGRRQRVGAVAVLTSPGRQALESQGRRAVIQHLRQHLAAHFDLVLLPRHWRFPQQLPMNERGKLTQAALAALFSPVEDDAATA